MTTDTTKDYTVIEDFNIDNIKEKVNQHLKDGFELSGGISTHLESSKVVYCQAMIKIKENN